MKDSDLTELPRVTEPISAPSPLQNLVEEYNSRAKLGELATCSLLLKDALGYFARYYSAVCVAACRELDCLPGEVAQNWSGTPNVEAALPVLQECLERLKTRDERIARKLCLVFFEQDGDRRAFAHQVLPGQENRDFEVSKFCMTYKQEMAEADSDTLCKAARHPAHRAHHEGERKPRHGLAARPGTSPKPTASGPGRRPFRTHPGGCRRGFSRSHNRNRNRNRGSNRPGRSYPGHRS